MLFVLLMIPRRHGVFSKAGGSGLRRKFARIPNWNWLYEQWGVDGVRGGVRCFLVGVLEGAAQHAQSA